MYKTARSRVVSLFVALFMVIPAATLSLPAQVSAASPCPYTKYYRVICANKTSRKLFLFEGGKQVMVMDARFGSSRYPTREGFFRVQWKSANHVSSIYGSAMPFSMFFSGGQAIHYSSDFASRGYNGASHGCINLRSYSGSQALFNRTPVGTPVVVYRW